MIKKIHVFRVKPGQELVAQITSYCSDHGITSAVVLGIIGSVQKAKLNFLMALPGKFDQVEYLGPLEIVGAQGSIANKNNEVIIHVHIQLSDRGAAVGGHLVEATVFSTAEVVLGQLSFQLRRYADEFTGLNELMEE